MGQNAVFRFLMVLVSLLSFSVLALSFDTVLADDSAVDIITLTVPVTCTLSGVGMNTHNATINNGQYNSAIGETTLKAFCNDNEGFAIYAIGYTDDEDGKNVLTSSTLGNTYDITTGTATSGSDSKWAFKVAKNTNPAPTYPIIIAGSAEDSLKEQGDPDYGVFQAVPDDYVKVAYRTTSTDIGPNAEGAVLTTTYQAYVSESQPAGSYVGKVKFTLIHPHDGAKPEKPEAPATSCTTPVPNVKYMQDINSSNIATVLQSLIENSPYYLRDKRDDQPYCVSKLKDGKLWMTENLNLAGGTTLSSLDTDFDSSYTLPTTNGWTVSDGKLILPASATKNTNNNNLTDSSQFSRDNYAYVFNSGVKENCGASGQNLPCHSYYSWDAATLGSGRTLNVENQDAPYSVCPKGWKLPTTGSSANNGWKRGDFYTLALSYGSNLESSNQDSSAETGANFFNNAGPSTTPDYLIPGFYMSGALNSSGSYGLYWSSSSYSTTARARSMAISPSFVDVANYASRRSGFSVRCLFGE